MKADLTFASTPTPPGLRCSSGHVAAENTRFFQVSGAGPTGTYCEPCLIVANYLAARLKNERTK